METKKADKVVICGLSQNSCAEVAYYYDNPEWEIWGLNQLYKVIPTIEKQAKRWFQLHYETVYSQFQTDQTEWLAKFDGPVYMIKKHPLTIKRADMVVINKIDLAEILEFDIDALVKDVREVDANISVHKVSAKTGSGIQELITAIGL